MTSIRNYKLLVLDWGIGGLPLFQNLKNALPDIPLLYLSDSGSIPYGKQDGQSLKMRLNEIAVFAREMGIHTIAVACNAMSSILLSLVSSTMSADVLSLIHSFISYPLPTGNRVGIIGGCRTIESGIYQKAFKTAGNTVNACPTQELSAFIEAGNLEAVPPFLEKTFSVLGNIDTLVLACTHYPAVSSIIHDINPGLIIIDPVYALFNECMKRLTPEFPGETFKTDNIYRNKTTHINNMQIYYTTGDEKASRISAEKAFGFYDLPFKKIPINFRI